MPENQPGKGLGHFLGAMRIDAFRTAEAFKKDMDNWIQRFRAAETIDGYEQVLIPGDPERLFEEQRMKEGIPILETVVEDLAKVGSKFNISL
jgi:LDH2 family malate/lactate/ureidoglycolate dehydrogenase